MALPTQDVLDAFGADRPPLPLTGGEGRTVRAGRVVLKPVSPEGEAEMEWCQRVYREVEGGNDFGVPRPIDAAGHFVVDGWAAWEFVDGETVENGGLARRVAACAAFHRAVAGVPRPAFLDVRSHAWAVADRVAFGERDWEPHPRLAPALWLLDSRLEPINVPSQIIHGDITGNMIAGPDERLYVIDFSPYWRPARFADAILVVDAVVWEGAPTSIAGVAGLDREFFQLLVRAATRRLVEVDAHHRLGGRGEAYLEQAEAYAGVLGWLEAVAPGFQG